VFDNITVLMERVSAFLENLQHHIEGKRDEEEKLDKRLRSTVYRVLMHFLTILAHAHSLTRDWKAKAKLAFKVGALGDDTGITDAMAELEKLIVNVTRTEITMIVVNLSKAAQDIRSLAGNVEKIANVSDSMNASIKLLETSDKKSQTEKEERKRQQQIREALRIPESASDHIWAKRHDDCTGRAIEGTGKWLCDNPVFQRWAGLETGSRARDGNPETRMQIDLLTVKAEKGYGKSHLSSIVIKHLMESYARDPKAAVAYYYFERSDQNDQKNRTAKSAVDNRGSDETATRNAINEGLRAVIYQLASSQSSLGKSFATLIQKPCVNKQSGFGKTTQLWNCLIADFRKVLDGTFFVVLDGIDISDSESDRPLASVIREVMNPAESSGLKVRLLVTGRQDALGALTPPDAAAPLVINIWRYDYVLKRHRALNENDLKLFAEERLEDMEIFGDDALKKRTITELVKGAKGDFKALDLKLSKIRQCRSPREVEKELTFAGEGKEQGIEREIKWLNLTLKEEVRVRSIMHHFGHMLTVTRNAKS
jgi:hypothetical protein